MLQTHSSPFVFPVRGQHSPTSLSLHPLQLRWLITWWPLTLSMMTLVHHRDLVEEVVQVVPLFSPAQGAVEVAMVDLVEWEEVWDSWAALVDLEAASLADDPLSVHQRQILDHTTRLDSGACRALEVAEAEEVAEEDFHREARPSLTCHPISAHPCTLGRVSTRCCHLEEWVAVQEVEEVHLIQGLGCPNSNLHMDKVGIPSTAHPYPVALALVGLRTAP